jgi:hypothetical protein
MELLTYFWRTLGAQPCAQFRSSAKSQGMWITDVKLRSQHSIIVLLNWWSWSHLAGRKVLSHAAQQTDSFHVRVLVSSKRSPSWPEQEVWRAAALSPASPVLCIPQAVLPGHEQGDSFQSALPEHESRKSPYFSNYSGKLFCFQMGNVRYTEWSWTFYKEILRLSVPEKCRTTGDSYIDGISTGQLSKKCE